MFVQMPGGLRPIRKAFMVFNVGGLWYLRRRPTNVSALNCIHCPVGSRQYLRIDLVRRILSNHVKNGQTATGMPLQPRVQLQYIFVVDDNDVAVGDEVLNRPWAEDVVARHDGIVGVLYCR